MSTEILEGMELLIRIAVFLSVTGSELNVYTYAENRSTVTIGLFIQGSRYNITQLERTVECTETYINNQRQIFPKLKIKHVLQKKSPKDDFIAAGFSVCEMMKQGAVGLITLAPCKTTQYLAHVSERYGLPHVIIPLPLCSLELNPSIFSMRPKRESVLMLLIDVVKFKRWNRVIVLHDDSLGTFANNFVIAMTKISVRVEPIRIPNKDLTEAEAVTALKKICSPRRDKANILLLCSAHNAMMLFEQAGKVGLQMQEYLWLQAEQAFTTEAILRVTKPDASVVVIGDPEPAQCGNVLRSMLGFGCDFKVDQGQEALLVDSILTIAHAMNSAYGSSNMIYKPVSCGSKRKWDGYNVTRRALQIIRMEGITGDIAFDKDNFRNIHSTKGSFAFDGSVTERDLSTHYTQVGSWNSQNGLFIKNVLFPNEHRYFNNKTVRITVKEVPPFVYRIRKYENGTVDFDGFCKSILTELTRRLNFTYEVRMVDDSKFGSQEANGSWNGMVGEVMRGEADLGVGPLTITAERSKVIEFTIPYIQDSVGFILRTPRRQNRMFHLFRPFSSVIWMSLVAAGIVAGVTSIIVNRLTPKSGYRKILKDIAKDEISAKENLWFTLAMFMGHGTIWYPMSSSGRVLTVSIAFFTAIVSAHYTADIVAYLAVPLAPDHIKTLKELTTQDYIRPLLLDGSNLVTLFKESTDGVYSTISKMLRSSPNITDSDEAVELLLKEGRWAFLNDVTQLDYIISQNCTEFVMGTETFNRAGFGFLMPKDSSFASAVNGMILKMQESGLIERWRRHWWRNSLNCPAKNKMSSKNQMDLDSSSGIFLTVLIGALAGFIVLLAELGVHHFGLFWKRRSMTLPHNSMTNLPGSPPRLHEDVNFKFHGTNWTLRPAGDGDVNKNDVANTSKYD